MGNVIMKAQQIVYGASNVEAALDNLDVAELIELNKRMAAIDDWKANVHEVTYTGSELTINNALALPARSLKTTIEAIQDLHGYDHPWAGGAGKNKLSNNLYTDGTSANVTWEKLSDGRIKVKSSGAVSTSVKIDLGKLDVVEGSYIVTGIKSNAPNYIDIRIRSGSASGTQVAFCNNSTTSATFSTTAGTEYYGVIIIIANFNGEAILEPMVRLASIADDSFLPYSNICPISGRTEVEITRSDGDEISEDFTIQLGTTVYGADINWDTGVMSITTVTEAYTDNTGIDFVDVKNGYGRFAVTLPNGGRALPTNTICNLMPVGDMTDWNAPTGNKVFTGLSSAAPNRVGLAFYGIESISALSTFLTDNNMQICYPLATPTTIQLTPTQLQMLKGYNRVSLADGYGEIELKALVLGGDV